MKHKLLFLPFIILFISFSPPISAQDSHPPITIGWIGALTGPTAKWGASQAAMLGEEAVNQSGGINGRPLKILFEDTGCNGTSAVSAFRKLTQIDGVSYILGGHCSPDTLAFAPLAEKQKILTIASITSSPKVTEAGDYIFRMTPVSTKLADLLVPYARKKLGVKRLAILHEITDYVMPVAEKVKKDFEQQGGIISETLAFNPGETDFRSMLVKISKNAPDALYLGVQAPDTGMVLMKQVRELKLDAKIFGNEQFSSAFLSSKPEGRALLEGIVFAQPECDLGNSPARSFLEKYRKRYDVEALPFGCYTAEAFDAVQILAAALRKCGEDAECVKEYLYRIRDYQGASGGVFFRCEGGCQQGICFAGD